MEQQRAEAVVVSVSSDGTHAFSKPPQPSIELVVGWGVRGDAHAGTTVQHLHHRRVDATRPNLRQVHLLHSELFDELRGRGFEVFPGQLGENVTTHGVDLLALPRGARLHLGGTAVVEVTGLRNPCRQLDDIHPGLMQAVLEREQGRLIRKAGVMAVVIASGPLAPADGVRVQMPAAPHRALAPV